MHQDDWIILIFTILFIVVYGAYKTRKNKNMDIIEKEIEIAKEQLRAEGKPSHSISY